MLELETRNKTFYKISVSLMKEKLTNITNFQHGTCAISAIRLHKTAYYKCSHNWQNLKGIFILIEIILEIVRSNYLLMINEYLSHDLHACIMSDANRCIMPIKEFKPCSSSVIVAESILKTQFLSYPLFSQGKGQQMKEREDYSYFGLDTNLSILI
jgi:hypothetical protein